MRIAVTGTSGFVGGSVSRALSARGDDVSSLDAVLRDPVRSIDDGPFEWVLHFAACTSIAKAWADPFGVIDANLQATSRALSVAQACGARFVAMSSYVYGIPECDPVDENHPVRATNPYMASKIAGETVCREVSRLFAIPLVILRPFNLYGDGLAPGHLVSDLLGCVRRRELITLNDGSPCRDHLFIDDFIELLVRLLAKPEVARIGGSVFNVGSGRSHSNLAVAETVRALARESRPVVVRGRSRRGDVNRCTADIALVRRTLEWAPRYDLHAGLSVLISTTSST